MMKISNPLAKLEPAVRALGEARNLDEIEAIRDTAIAAQAWARARDLGIEAENYAMEIRLRASRKAGELLAQMEKNPGRPGPGRGKAGSPADPALSEVPTLAAIGIDKHTAHEFRLAAALAESGFGELLKQDGRLTVAALRRAVKEQEREQRVAEDQQAAENIADRGKLWRLQVADFRDARVKSIQAIITDPPYPEKYLPLYSDLAAFAQRTLTDGGSLVALVNHAHLPEILQRLGQGLTYRWTMALLLAGPRARMYQRKINVGWKPVVIFTKGDYAGPTHTDVVHSAERQKDRFEWQQNVGAFCQLVEIFSRPGDLVCDPMCGVGTTGAVAVSLGRQFIGIDSDPERIASAKVLLDANQRRSRG